MKDQFVTYEIAKAMKELGFNEECLAYYQNGLQFVNDDDKTEKTFCNQSWISHYSDTATTPLWQQAIDWLRNSKKLEVSVAFAKPYKKYCCDILNLETLLYCSDNLKVFDTYEQAREVAILKALELIKK